MEFTPYTTKQGDTWPLISYKAYGDVNKFPDIMLANTRVAWDDILTPGIELSIPIQEQTTQKSSIMPPWKKQNA